MPPKTTEKSDAKTAKEILRLRNSEDPPLSWAKIGEATGVSPSQAMLLYGEADKANAYTGTDEAIKKKIVADRNKGLSWGVLMSRSGWGLHRVKGAYADVTGKDPAVSNIGKGGRPAGSGGALKAKKAVKKAAKKAPAKKAVRKAAKKAPAKKARATKKVAGKRVAKKRAASTEAA